MKLGAVRKMKLKYKLQKWCWLKGQIGWALRITGASRRDILQLLNTPHGEEMRRLRHYMEEHEKLEAQGKLVEQAGRGLE